MSSAPTQIAVAPSASLVAPPPQIQKDYLEEPISRQNSLGNRHRGGPKGKHLTRSHAMRESTSPPRTPTPRSELLTPTSPSGMSSSPETVADSRLHYQHHSSTSSSPLLETPSNMLHNSNNNGHHHQQQQQQQQQQLSPPQIFSIDGGGNQSQLDLDFPKLTPPKSKSPRSNNNNNNHSNNNNNNNAFNNNISNNSNNHNDKTTSTSSATGTTTNVATAATGTTASNNDHGNKNVFSQQQSANGGTGGGNDTKQLQNSNNHHNHHQNQSSNTTIGETAATAATSSTQTVTSVTSVSSTQNNLSSSSNGPTSASATSTSPAHQQQQQQTNDSSLLVVVTTTKETQQNQHHHHQHHQQQNNNHGSNSNLSSANVPHHNNHHQQQHHHQQQNSYERDRSRDSNNSQQNHHGGGYNDEMSNCESPTDGMIRGGGGGGGGGGNKKRSGGAGSSGVQRNDGMGGGGGGALVKGNKPRLKNMGSSSSVEGGNNSSGFISRDSSTEQFTDQSGVDLIQFFKETLNKNVKDRTTLMKIERELLALALDRTRNQVKFPAMSSYNRMLIHRVAAYFGMEHNVDATQQSVIAAVTKSTRIPEVRFKSLIRDTFTEEPRKSILKRDAHSFDECRQFLGPDRGMLDRKAKSFEEREEEYEKCDGNDDTHWPWSSTESTETVSRLRVQNNRLLKVQSVEARPPMDGRPCVSKSHSFGGYGGQSGPLMRGDSVTSTKSAGPRLFSKQDSTGSTNTPWRLSPSSSGYKTQSLRSDSVTPSPTGYGSGDHTPEPSVVQSPATACGVVWAVTDMASVPRGSVLIDPQTLQPIVNQDGTIYHYDPSNLPPKTLSAKPPITNLQPPPGKNIGGPPQHQQPLQQKSNNKMEKQQKSLKYSNNNTNNNNNSSNSNSSNSVSNSYNNDDNDDLNLGNSNSNSSQNDVNLNVQNVIVLDDGGGGGAGIVNCGVIDGNNHTPIQNVIETQMNETKEIIDENPSLCTNNDDANQMTNSSLNNSNSNLVGVGCGVASGATTPTGLSPTTTPVVGCILVKQTQKNQATSPNPPQQQQNQIEIQTTTIQNAEITTSQPNSLDSDNSVVSQTSNGGGNVIVVQNATNTNVGGGAGGGSINGSQSNANNVVITHHATTLDVKKDEYKPIQQPAITLMSYAPASYQSLDQSGMFQSGAGTAFPTTYQQGADGSVYAVPQAMMYAYPPPMDSEVPGYIFPIYDQTGGVQQRDTTTTLIAAPQSAASLYTQQSAGTTAVVPLAAYPQHLYQGQVVYAPEQYATAPAATGQVSQYPITYPMGYPYTYNGTTYQGYWGQPMTTYYVPQSQLTAAPTPTVSTSMIVPTATTNLPSSNPIMSGNPNGIGKRGSPPQGNQPQYAAHSIPLAADPTGGTTTTMYAIPPLYPGMLPYTTPATAGVISHQIPHTQNAVLNSVMPTPPPQQPPPQMVQSLDQTSSYHSMNTNNSATPQSTPSTPLPLPLPLPHQQKNPPLFATPPIIPNGFTPQLGNLSLHNGVPENTYERKMTNNGNPTNRRPNHINASAPNRQHSNSSTTTYYQSQGGGGHQQQQHQQPQHAHGHQTVQQNHNTIRKSYENTNNAANRNNVNTTVVQPKRNENYKGHQHHHQPQQQSQQQSSSSSPQSQTTSTTTINNQIISNQTAAGTPGEKSIRGPRPKPSNLDLRRSNSQRNTPSTNSTESNNSPNSITSNNDHPPIYMTRAGSAGGAYGAGGGGMGAGSAAAAHLSQLHQAGHIDPCHQQLISTYNPAGMYVKFGQTYFTHPSMTLSSNRRSPPNEVRPQLAPITGMYPTMNVMLSAAPRHIAPRQPNPNYKGNKPR